MRHADIRVMVGNSSIHSERPIQRRLPCQAAIGQLPGHDTQQETCKSTTPESQICHQWCRDCRNYPLFASDIDCACRTVCLLHLRYVIVILHSCLLYELEAGKSPDSSVS